MAIENGIGISKWTKYKQDWFAWFVSVHLRVASNILKRHKNAPWLDNSYWYFDLTAGSGYSGNMRGSPLIFLRKAVEYPRMMFNIILMEKRKKNCIALREVIAPFSRFSHLNIRVIQGDHRNVLPKYFDRSRKKRMGLLYVDPTGNRLPYELLADMSKQYCYSMFDFLLHLSATNHKRIRSSGPAFLKRAKDFVELPDKDIFSLMSKIFKDILPDALFAIRKNHYLIHKPLSPHQWTFILALNWPNFPKSATRKFYDIFSLEGRKILEKITFTREEYKFFLSLFHCKKGELVEELLLENKEIL